eukprot:CAMPEP_0117625806 /NCGR_PEP_ID=MMETSP0802-20121206/1094_1 /TAXON_ID=38833 /ORGANISM="Micromonas sp., Strain CCMP2099" /LENGTH=171 /DNA_ID=CAMNT_0005429905 /DNA_START=43 /DNA_END=559 /DNA_ORIENTATION=+
MAAIVASNFAVCAPAKVAQRKITSRRSALPGTSGKRDTQTRVEIQHSLMDIDAVRVDRRRVCYSAREVSVMTTSYPLLTFTSNSFPINSSQALRRGEILRMNAVASSKVEKMTAALTAASAAALANPLVAEAAMTPSLKNTLLSVAAGGIVLAAIGVAVVGVSTFDKIGRK